MSAFFATHFPKQSSLLLSFALLVAGGISFGVPQPVLAGGLTDAQCLSTFGGTCKAQSPGLQTFCDSATEIDKGACTAGGFTLAPRQCCAPKVASAQTESHAPTPPSAGSPTGLSGSQCQSLASGAYCAATGITSCPSGTALGSCTGTGGSLCCSAAPGSPGAAAPSAASGSGAPAAGGGTVTPPAGGGTVTPPASPQSIVFTNPLAFNTVEEVLDSILSTLRGIIVILALVFLVIGAVLYITSAGNDSRMKTAKGAITAAMIGLAIGLAAPSFLKEIGTVLGWGAVNSTAVAGAATLSQIATSVLNFLLSIVGVLAIIMLVVGAIMYLTAAGKEDQLDTAKKIVWYSIIGIVIALAALVIVSQIAAFF